MNANTDMFDGLETAVDVDTSPTDVVLAEGVDRTSPEWNNFVMGFFEEDELIDGMPVVAGLRRVAELMIGRIEVSRPVQVFPPADGKSIGRATVVWQITFQNGLTFGDVADCWEGNTDDNFCVYAVATAGTRAEARSLRKALGLRKCSAEEITNKDTGKITRDISTSQKTTTTGEYEDSDRMTDKQRNFLDIKCKQLDVNTGLFFKETYGLSTTRKINKQQASEAIDQLNKYQNGAEVVPKSILGYVSGE